MRILAIETSCDDTAISIVEAKGGFKKPVFKVLAHHISSQTEIHQKWGGVVPTLAKREHGRNLVPLLIKSLTEAGLNSNPKSEILISKQIPNYQKPNSKQNKLAKILEREPELKELFFKHLIDLPAPKIDIIAVTKGPGLEPALWVGINFAKALSILWNIPAVPTNHLAGHLYANLLTESNKLRFPALALIVSGGHTELILVKNWLKYKVIGRTRDDAVGEAFDKVARILGLAYPGGPAIADLTQKYADKTQTGTIKKSTPLSLSAITDPRESACHLHKSAIKLPRPMINSPDFDFSFSGLKTAVLYLVQKLKIIGKFDEQVKASIAKDFQQACIDVLIAKTAKAIDKYQPKNLIIGGGVVANLELRRQFAEKINTYQKIKLLIPEGQFSTDNASMIAVAAYLQTQNKKISKNSPIKASGHFPLK